MKRLLIPLSVMTILLSSCASLPQYGNAPREAIVDRGEYAESTIQSDAGKQKREYHDLAELFEQSEALQELWERGYVPQEQRKELYNLHSEMEAFTAELEQKLAEMDEKSLDTSMPEQSIPEENP